MKTAICVLLAMPFLVAWNMPRSEVRPKSLDPPKVEKEEPKPPDISCLATGNMSFKSKTLLVLEMGCVDQNNRGAGVSKISLEVSAEKKGFFIPPLHAAAIAVESKGEQEKVILLYKKDDETIKYEVPAQEGAWTHTFVALLPFTVHPKFVKPS